MAIRRSPTFRFDYFLRSLSVELLGKRCEQLMKAAEKEVEQLERKAREHVGLPVDPGQSGESLQLIQLPELSILRDQMQASRKEKVETERKQLEEKLSEVEKQIKDVQDKLKAINESADYPTGTSSPMRELSRGGQDIVGHEKENQAAQDVLDDTQLPNAIVSDDNGALGPDGFLEFPAYDGLEPPKECKKAFTHFCLHTRKEIKASLDPALKLSKEKKKEMVHGILRERWVDLDNEDKTVWRQWASWDKKRFERDLAIYEEQNPRSFETLPTSNGDKDDSLHLPKKRKSAGTTEVEMDSPTPFAVIPKKRKNRA
jgi:SLIDE